MSSIHEIITLQIGKYSNFIGTHWWNIQESSFCYSPDSSVSLDISHDVTFREGLNLRGEVTYTPRLVAIDLQDNFRSLPKESSLYKTEQNNTPTAYWDGPVEVVREPSTRRNPFLEERQSDSAAGSGKAENACIDVSEFESPSTSWSDYLKTHLHPNSYCLFNKHSSSEDVEPLELYSSGDEAYCKNGEIFEESIRKMAEECDYLQGFQLIYDAHNGFSGISSKVLQHLDEEYKRRSTLCFPVYQESTALPIQNMKKHMHRLYAVLLSMSNLNTHCTMFSPLSLTDDIVNLSLPYRIFPYLHYKEDLMYHTSAILAAAIETLSSPFRLRSLKHSMFDVANSMSTYGRKLVCSSMCLPFPLSQDAYLSAMVEKEVQEYFMTSLTPFYKPDSERTLLQSAVLRGVPRNKFEKPGKQRYQSFEAEELFGEYLNKYSPSSVATATVIAEKCSVDSPFPKIFKDIVSDCGLLSPFHKGSQSGLDKVPIAASFSSSDSAGQFLEDLLSQASKLNFREYVKCAEESYERDVFLEVLENLIGLQDNYTNY